ncbi:hypothetical protein LF817_10755 [Halobacillus sp. A1]|uniref:hypothetical protein n=1 Tax=Halobacillus sp. A1 TaxID=2880262 RepID=UPI0020A6B765|nr:hypothetical protein [Halobacillus sp. A1]MCP3031823.1 hypothetical protein [Halobacillus sp. A1]
MKKKGKWIGLVFLLVIFAAAVQWSMSDEDNATEKLEVFQNPTAEELELPQNVTRAESRETIDNFYNMQSPGYRKAKELEIIQSPGQSYEIPGHEGELTIDEIWHSQYQVFMYYSVDLKVFEDKDNLQTSPLFDISSVNVNPEEGNMTRQSHSPFQSNESNDGLMSYDGKLYGVLVMPPLEQKEPMDMEINETIPTSFRISMDNTSEITDEEPLTYTYEKDQEIRQTADFNDVYEKSGLTIKPIDVALGITSNKITLEITHDEHEVSNLTGSVSDENTSTEISYLHPVEGQPDVYEAQFTPYDEDPESLDIDIESVSLLTDEDLSFDVDVSDYEEEVGEERERVIVDVNEKTSEKLNTDIDLEQKVYDPSMGMEIHLGFEPKPGDHTLTLSPNLMRTPASAMQYEPFIAVNEDGEEIMGAGGGINNGNTVLSLSTSSLQDSNMITIEMPQLQASQKVDFQETVDLTE